jgi:hypothetical protein
MITVEIAYRPIEFVPWMRRVEKQMPARWSEMNARQMASVPSLQQDKFDDRKLLQIFLGLKKGIAERIDNYQAFCITRFMKYIREPEPLGYFVIKKIAGFSAPADNLKGVKFGQFIFGDTYYQNYISGKRGDLDKFIACYYTGKRGFKEELIESHAGRIHVEDPATREAISINYGLIREWLALAYTYVFQKSTAKADNSKGWVGVFDMLVKDDLANQDKYAELPVSTVLRHLNNLLIERYKYGSQV